MTNWTAVSVTGHRDLTDAQLAWLRPELDRVLAKLRDEHGTTDAATGVALGSDIEFGWAALHANLQLHAHIPFPQQPDRWPYPDREIYRRMLDRCTSKTAYGPTYDPRWFFARNQGLVDFAAERGGVMVAIWDPRRRDGGTFDAVKRAASVLPVIHFDLERLQVHGPGCSCVESLKPSALF
ncbi:hypothetical protein [Dactylosporangium salmoneum]|uniref:Uncharacterized protein n=1 Tax=Dactylosporangium salmoneum TaxID=53361 RepID=A0ABP5TBX6_9ACTN